jgi:hypothetical protein
MKLYGAPNPAPNPRRVRIAIAEKGIDLVETPVDLRARAQITAIELDPITARIARQIHPDITLHAGVGLHGGAECLKGLGRKLRRACRRPRR